MYGAVLAVKSSVIIIASIVTMNNVQLMNKPDCIHQQ